MPSRSSWHAGYMQYKYIVLMKEESASPKIDSACLREDFDFELHFLKSKENKYHGFILELRIYQLKKTLEISLESQSDKPYGKNKKQEIAKISRQDKMMR